MPLNEAYTIGTRYKLNRIKEFDLDADHPPEGALVMWEAPEPGTDYTIGVDPSWGVGEDRAAIHVLRNGTLYVPDKQVAEFCSDELNPHDLVPICYMLGNLYKNTKEEQMALMSVECNISDDITTQLRDNYNYDNLFIWKFYDNIKGKISNKVGWYTNARTRPKIIMKAIHYIKQGWWDISSPWLIGEMQTIEKLEEKAKVAAASGHKDDLFMAAAIALWSAHDLEFNELGMTEETAKKRERRTQGIVDAFDNIVQKPIKERKDFINTACSWDDMQNVEFPLYD